MAIFEPLFRALNQAGVRYVVVGGLAVVLQGHARLTADVDLVVDLEDEQARRAIEALSAMNLRPRAPVNPGDFADRTARDKWIREQGMQVFSMYDPANPLRVVDLFVSHPVPFEDLYSRADVVDLKGTSVRVASIPDLIHLKSLAGRPEDRDDIKHLEEILKERREREKD